MAQRDDLLAALRAADAAGDAPAATAIAKRLQMAPQTAATGAAGTTPQPAAVSAPEGMLKADGSSDIWDRMRYGLAGSGIQAYLGLKQSLGHTLTPEEQSTLKMSEADVNNSGFAGKAAKLVGDVGQGVAAALAVPEVGIVKALPKLLRMSLGGAGMSAATTPVDSTNSSDVYDGKMANAAVAAAAGPVLGGAVKGAKALGTGLFSASKDAADLMAQGINPTLRQGAATGWGRFVGGLTSGFADSNGRQEQEVLDNLTNGISNGAVSAPGATVGQRLGMLGPAVSQAYQTILGGKRFPMNNAIRDDMLQQGDNIGQTGGRFLSQVKDARKVLDNVVGSDRNSTSMGIDKLQQNYQQPLQTAISDADDDKVKQALIAAKNVLINQSRNSKLSPDELSSLGDVDSRYFDLMRLKEAGNINDTGVDIPKLVKAYEGGPGMDVIGAQNNTNDSLIGPLSRSIGTTQQKEASRTAMNMGRRMIAPGLAVGGGLATGATGPVAALAAPFYGLSALGQTAGGAKYLLGQYPWQKNLSGALDNSALIDALRNGSTNIGAAYAAQQ